MLKKLATLIGLGVGAGVAAQAPGYSPYRDEAKNLLRAAEAVDQQIGPWEEPRLSPPTRAMMRLTFLVTDGLYFGEGPVSVLHNDPLGGQVVSSATALLVALTERVRPK